MDWRITKFPELSAESIKAISDWIQKNYEEREQARDDTNTYGPQAVFGSTSAVYLYSKALATIDRLDKALNLLLTSPTVFTFDSKNYSMVYNQYLAEVPNLKSFKKTGWGTSSNDTLSLDNKWADNTIRLLAGDDTVSISNGGHRVFANLGSGNDFFQGNSGSDGVFGDIGDDKILGGDGFDVLDGGGGNDLISGDSGIDMIYGGLGDDILSGGAGDDFIDGGEGNDTATYQANFNDYQISFNNGLLKIIDSTLDRDGSDALTRIEYLKFNDITKTVIQLPGAPNQTPTYTITPSATTINEGATLTTSVATINVASGATLYYTLSGTGITTADFSFGALTGSGTVGSDGNLAFGHTLANDLTTEGAETLEIKLFSDEARKVQVGSTASVLLTDTSVASTIKIENNGAIELIKVLGNKYSAQSKVTGATSYAIKKDGNQIYQGIYGNDWSVLAAETVNGVNQVLWKNTAANRLHLWKLDGNWNWQSSSLWDEASSSIGQQLETEFDIDLDGNGTVAVASTIKIENNGSIELIKVLGNKYSAQSKVTGATSYAIKKDGNQIYQGIYGNDWSVLAAETVNGVNQVLWKNTAANRLHLWKLDGNWNWQSSSLWDEASSSIGQQLETEFDIDLDGNGTVAVASTIKIENNGSIELIKVLGNKYSAQSKVTGATSYAIKKDGNQIYQGIYGNDWSVLAAETVNGVNQVLWKNTASNRLHLWKLDGNWNWQSSSLWDEASSSIGQQLETEFDIDLDGNGTVAVASIIKIENNGAIELIKVLGNKYSAQSKVTGATSYAIKKDGNQIYQGIYGNDWSVLAAETVNGVNQVLWKNTAANRLHLWKLDGNWNWQSSSLWDEASSSIGQQLETEFDIDLDGNGTVAVASTTKIENIGSLKTLLGTINNDIITSQGGEIVYGGRGSDRITGQAKISADGTRRIPSFLTGGSGDDTYVVPQGVFSVVLDAGDGLDTVNMSASNIENVQFIRVNQRDIYATDATTSLLLIDPQGLEGNYNAIENFIIGNNRYNLTQLTKIVFGSSNFYGDYTYKELQSNGFFDLGIVGLDPLLINGYIKLVINNNLLS